LFLFYGCGEKKEQTVEKKVIRPIKMIIVTFSVDAIKRRFPGILRAARRVELSFRILGPLIELPVEEDQRVKERGTYFPHRFT